MVTYNRTKQLNSITCSVLLSKIIYIVNVESHLALAEATWV